MRTLFLDSGQGVLPFIKEILIQKKKGDFIFYLDENNFPYGNKSEHEIRKILLGHLKRFEQFNIDRLFIACNTLSSVLKSEDRYSYSIENILDYNLKKMDKDACYICTKATSNYLKNKNINSIAMIDLAYQIENLDIKNIIKNLKTTSFPKKIILGCTHYPLIKFLFEKYTKSQVFSFEKEYISSIKSEGNLNITIYTNKKEFYKKIIILNSIKFLPLT